jgi:cytochrome c biogenesis protein ResB
MGPGEGRAAVEVPGGTEQIEKILAGHFTRWHRRDDKYFAHAGLRQRIGPTIIHTGIVVILLAGLVHLVLDKRGLILSEGRFLATEGETTNLIYTPIHLDHQINPQGNLAALPIPFDVKLLDFDEIKHPNSDAPAYFSSLLEVRDHETGAVRVAKLDMNHSLRIGAYEFHQAGFQQVPPVEGTRTDFLIRDARTGERIGLTDATPETRVQVEDLDLFLEVDGIETGDAWRLYTAASPGTPIASGTLQQSAFRGTFSFTIKEFYPDFHFTPELGAYTRSPNPDNPAAVVEINQTGKPAVTTVLFLDPELHELVPGIDSHVDLRLADVRVRGVENPSDFESFDWTRSDAVRLEIVLTHRQTGTELGTQLLPIGGTSEPIRLAADPLEVPATDSDSLYTVSAVGTSPRYITILSVVREPMTGYYTLGVALMAIGALLTFSGRYRALYGTWDAAAAKFHFALVPRFGKRPDPIEFRRLVEALSAAPNIPAPSTETRTSPLTEAAQ